MLPMRRPAHPFARMQRAATLAVASLLGFASLAPAQRYLQVPPNDEGLPGAGTIRRYEWFQKLWAEKRGAWAADAENDRGAVVFLGDSITQGWGPDLGGSFGDLQVANRGISGDTTRGMLLRLEGDVLALDPRAVVLLMGTNDLEEGDAPETIAANVAAIVRRIAAHDPELPIVLCKVFPSSAKKKRPAAAIRRINELQAAAVAACPQVSIVDTWSIFAGERDGDAQEAEFPDLLHPNEAGYAKWASALRPVLAALPASDAADRDARLAVAEPRLRAIYERGTYRARGARAEWLPQGSMYMLDGVVVDAQTGERAEPTDEQRRALQRPSPQPRIAIRNGDLVVPGGRDGREVHLTSNAAGREGVRNQRAQWSPDRTQVLFVEADSSQVRIRQRLLNDDPSYPSVAPVRFARVGETITKLRVGVAREGSDARWLELPNPDEGFYLGQVEWAGNSREVLVEWLSRFRNERKFFLCDAATGRCTTIFEESDPAWVVASYGVNSGLEWVKGGEAFVVIHERDGWRHAWLHGRDGTLRAQLTRGEFDIIKRAAIDEEGGYYYFYAAPGDAARRYLYRVRLDGSSEAIERITPDDQPGTHDYRISPDGRVAIHTWSALDRPPVTDVVQLPTHKVVRTLEDNAALRTRIATDAYRPTEFFAVDIGDGVTLDGWLMKPPGFDPSRRYPVLVYVYSEPHAQTVLDAWGKVHADYHRLISDLGYLVVSFDGRGTPAPKGAAWRRAVFGSLGPLSTRDQAAALEALARGRTYIDLHRVGIWGWSGGGSNTLNAMFRRPDLYDVGIAVAAKPQPHLYNAWFQEIYMRDRTVNPDGYRRSAPIHFAEGLTGDLLIVHGTGELNTHVQITEGLVDRLIELGKPFDYFAYPHRRHGLSEGKGTAVHLRMLMIRYLLDHLEPGPR